MRRWISFAVLLTGLLVAYPVMGAGFIIVDEAHWLPGPIPPFPPHPIPPRPIPPWPPMPIVPPRPHVFAPLEVSSVKVDTRIIDQVAATSIEQEFYNPNPARLEGTFIFPIPAGAHLDKFSMEIDGKQVQAELLPAEKARRIYEDIVRKVKDPALLEYSGRDVYKARIFPIEPNSRKQIRLSYTQLLKADSGLVSYVLPLNAEKFSPKPVRNVSVKITLESRQPIKSIYSPSHNVEIRRDGPHRATAGYEQGGTTSDADLALYFAPEKDEIGINLLTHRVEGENGYFLLLASPGVDVAEKRVVKKDVAFVLDTSGSMAGKKLEQAKKALLFCIENLNDGDRFDIIRFSTEVEPLFDKLVVAERANREKAENFIKDLKPIGGTAIDEALKHALSARDHDRDSARPYMIIFLTDGRPTIGTTNEDQILAGVKRTNGARDRVFCFGIGTDVNTHLLDKITEETRGFSQYVLPEEDLEVKVSNFYSKIKEPVLANPTIKFTGDVRATSLYPSPLPDLFKGEQLVLVGRFAGKGDSAVIIDGSVNGDKKQFTYEVTFSGGAENNEFIPRLWATRRVGYLLDEIRLHGENAELRDEVTDPGAKIRDRDTLHRLLDRGGRDPTGRSTTDAVIAKIRADAEAREEAALYYGSYNRARGGTAGVSSARQGASHSNRPMLPPGRCRHSRGVLQRPGSDRCPRNAGYPASFSR